MTEISIRNGIQKALNTNFIITAWDTAVNKQYLWLTTTGAIPAKYTFWSDYDMSGNKDMRTCYSTTDSQSPSLLQDFLPYISYSGNTFGGYTLQYPLLAFSPDAGITYNGTEDIIFDYAYPNRSFVAIARCNVDANAKQFIMSIGKSQTVGSDPLWTLGDIHIYKDVLSNHDHLISRIGSSYKSTRINNFNMADIHVYAIEWDGASTWSIYLDSVLITTHTSGFTGGLWNAPVNYNLDINTMWCSGWVGYIHLADGASYNSSDVGFHAIVHAKYDVATTGQLFTAAIDEMCHFRYGLPNPPVTSHNSTANTTLSSTQVIVFDSFTFGNTQQIL